MGRSAQTRRSSTGSDASAYGTLCVRRTKWFESPAHCTGRRPVTEILVRVVAPHFVAGVVARDGRIVEAAPILYWMMGFDGRQFFKACSQRLWHFETIDVHSPPALSTVEGYSNPGGTDG